MKKLIEDPDKFYTPKLRPSGHDIGRGFAKDNGGAIPPNLLSFPNTESNGAYISACKLVGMDAHPARFPAKLPEFFVRMLTTPGDTVLDIFAGSNTTGQVAEAEGRHWLAFEERADYTAASVFRFLDKGCEPEMVKSTFEKIQAGEHVKVPRRQSSLALADTDGD